MLPNWLFAFQQHLTFRRVAASCLLLLYLLAATPVSPLFTALLALADRSHHLTLEQTADGPAVVLHHDATTFPGHRHSGIAAALTFISSGSAPAQRDHIIQFSAATTCEKSTGLEATDCAPVSRPLPDHLFPPFPFSDRQLAALLPPNCRSSHNVGFTVLLI